MDRGLTNLQPLVDRWVCCFVVLGWERIEFREFWLVEKFCVDVCWEKVGEKVGGFGWLEKFRNSMFWWERLLRDSVNLYRKKPWFVADLCWGPNLLGGGRFFRCKVGP